MFALESDDWDIFGSKRRRHFLMDSRISVFDLILRLAGRLAGQLGKPGEAHSLAKARPMG